MKPFDLEAAKRGEPIYIHLVCEPTFIGLREDGRVVAESAEGWLGSYMQSDVFMAPKKRTVWVNLYPTSLQISYWHNSEEEASKLASSNRIGGKAYPVEIEE